MNDFWFNNGPSINWTLPSKASASENRQKLVRVPAEVAKKHMENAVKEVLRTSSLPENTTVDGGLYSSGGHLTLTNPEFPPSADGRIQDITPAAKDRT
jgi:hypothetical protein